MPDTQDIPSWWAGVAAAGTFIGGVLAVIFKGSKSQISKSDSDDLPRRITRLETQMEEVERNNDEAKRVRDSIFRRLNEIDQKATTTLAILNDRRNSQ